MDLAELEITKTIFELLPGFVTAWIFYGLTAHPRPSQFERVIQALIFTIFTEVVVIIIKGALHTAGSWWSLGIWSLNVDLVWKVSVSMIIGLLFAWLANNNKLHTLLRPTFTRQTSYPSEWFSAFSERRLFIYLHLTSGRTLYAWPEEWPNEPGKGHFRLSNAVWILEDNEREPLLDSECILVPASLVEIVQFEKSEAQSAS